MPPKAHLTLSERFLDDNAHEFCAVSRLDAVRSHYALLVDVVLELAVLRLLEVVRVQVLRQGIGHRGAVESVNLWLSCVYSCYVHTM